MVLRDLQTPPQGGPLERHCSFSLDIPKGQCWGESLQGAELGALALLIHLLGKSNGYPRSQPCYFQTVSGFGPTHLSLCTSHLLVDFGGEILVPWFALWDIERKGLSLLLLCNRQLAVPVSNKKRGKGAWSLFTFTWPRSNYPWPL